MSKPSTTWEWICLIVRIIVATLPDIIDEVNNFGTKSVPTVK